MYIQNNVNLWKAVKLVKSLNSESIPPNLTLGGVPVADGCAAESFGNYFSSKIKFNVSKAKVDNNQIFFNMW